MTPHGNAIAVHGLHLNSEPATAAYNLTVDKTPTYFVQAGANQVLVHNICFRDALKADYGFAPPPGFEAHHIIPANHSLAAEARKILGRSVIDDASLNGVFLRRGTSADPGLHHFTLPHDYVEAVNARIVAANATGGRAAALSELATIRNELIFLQIMVP